MIPKTGHVYACKWDNVNEDNTTYYNHITTVTKHSISGEFLFSIPSSIKREVDKEFAAYLTEFENPRHRVIDLGPLEDLQEMYPEIFI